jgi:penicillin amidase
MSDITPRDMMELQFDNYNLKAEESLPTFLNYLDTTQFTQAQKSAYTILKAWDYENDVNSEGASYYEAWWDALFPLVWDEIKNAKVALDYPTAYTTIKLIKEKPDLNFFDITDTPAKETAREVIQQAFITGMDAIEKWKVDQKKEPRWADFKDTFVGHLLQGLPAFSYHVQHGGNHDIVNASSRRHGPSWRMVVSLEKTGVRAWGVYPGGQSGNPGSPYYNNMLNTWANGNHYPFQFSSDSNLKSALATLTLKPVAP